jgi:hypothetical protein
MKKLSLALFALPALTACGEVEVPFLAPVSVDLPELEPSEDGLIRYVQATEMKSIDQLRMEAPVELQGLSDFRLTALEIKDPEFDLMMDEVPTDDLKDPEFDTLSSFASAVRVFISFDQELSDDDVLLAAIGEFPEGMDSYEAEITDHAVLADYDDGGEWALIVDAEFTNPPPGEMELPMTLFGTATYDAMEGLTSQ